MASRSHGHARARLQQLYRPASRSSVEVRDRGDQILTSDQATAVPDNEIYRLDRRIFRTEITLVISPISHVVLLPTD